MLEAVQPEIVAYNWDRSTFDHAARVRLAAEEIEDVFSAAREIARLRSRAAS
jgi:hypothetical protein